MGASIILLSIVGIIAYSKQLSVKDSGNREIKDFDAKEIVPPTAPAVGAGRNGESEGDYAQRFTEL